MITKEEIQKGISDGNLNPRILGEFFDDLKIKSFSYDYNIQRDLVNYFEVRIPLSEGKSQLLKGVYSSKHSRSKSFIIEHQFTIAGMREAYKRSGAFHKYLDYVALNTYRQFFHYNILVFVGDAIYNNYRVMVYNNKLELHLLESEIPDTAETLTVMFIPDSVIAFASPKPSDFNGTNIDAYHFDNNETFDKINNYIGFWIDKNTGAHYMIPDMEYHKEDKYFAINDLLPTHVANYQMMVIGIDIIQSVTDFPAGTEWISFSRASMPLPKDDIVIMRRKGSYYVPNDGSVTLTEYYPNIYRINNPNNYDLRLLALYEEADQNEHLEYDNEIEYYFNRMDLLDEYKDGTVPSVLKEFKPISWDYSIDDFLKKNPYQQINMQNIWDSFIYKMDSISTMLKKWCYLYEEYERRTYGFLTGWYHNIANYDNLEEKERTSTGVDFPEEPDMDYPFEETQYLFTYMNDPKYGDARTFCYFIDGRYTIPTKVILYKRYQYVYLPKRLIKRNSVIEVERFDGNIFHIPFDNLPAEGMDIDLSKILTADTIANCLFFVKDDGTFLNHNEIKSYFTDPKIGEEIEVNLDTSVFIVPKDSIMRIVPSDELVGANVMLCCNNTTYQFIARESGIDFHRQDPDSINLNSKKYIGQVKQNLINRLRIFDHTGRLLPKREYNVYNYHKYYDNPRFNIPIDKYADENFIVCYIGYDETLIYHRDHIPTNGLIELEGKASRPINLAYHDIYLDGFRLTTKDIKIITPFSFVITSLAKYDTVDNIEIYEKSHVPDKLVKFNYYEKSQYIMDKLFQNNTEFYDKVLESLDNITVTGRTPSVDDIRDWLYDFFHDYFPYFYHDGDKRYDLECYFHIFHEHDGRVLFDADDRVRWINRVETSYYLSHDSTITKYGEDPSRYPKPPDRDFAPSTLVPNTALEMDETEYSENGYRTDAFEPVYDNEFEPFKEEYVPTESDPNAIPYDEEYKNEGNFPHNDTAERYEYPLEDEPSWLYQKLTPDYYRMEDVYPGWHVNMRKVPEEDQPEFAAMALTNMSAMFRNCKKIQVIPELDWSNCTEAQEFFKGCLALNDVSDSIDTSRVSDFTSFFESCESITFNTISDRVDFTSARITQRTFYGCKALTSMIDMEYGNLTNMREMYAYSGLVNAVQRIECSSITSIDQLYHIFEGTAVKIVYLDDLDIDTARGLNNAWIGDGIEKIYIDGVRKEIICDGKYRMSDLFVRYKSMEYVTGGDLSDISDLGLNDMSYMFEGCDSLKAIPKLDWSNCTVAHHFAMNCPNLVAIDHDIDTSKVSDFTSFFEGCESITNDVVELIDDTAMTNTDKMFKDCKAITEMVPYKYEQITSMRQMYEGSGLTNKVQHLDVSAITNKEQFYHIFENTIVEDIWFDNISLAVLESILDRKFIGNNIVKIYSDGVRRDIIVNRYYKMMDLFPEYYDTMRELNESDAYDVYYPFDVMSYMFEDCKALTKLPKLDWINARAVDHLAYNCESLISLGEEFDTSSIKDFTGMFEGCRSLPNIALADFPAESIKVSERMFYGCKSITRVVDVNYAQITNMREMYAYSGLYGRAADIDCSSITSLDDLYHIFEGTDVVFASFTNLKKEFADIITLAWIGDKIEGIFVDGVRLKIMINKWYKMCDVYPDIYDIMPRIPDRLRFENLTIMDSMFEGCEQLTEIQDIDTHDITTFCRTFYGCMSLGRNLHWDIDVSSVTNPRFECVDTFAGSSIKEVSLIGTDSNVELEVADVIGENDINFITIDNETVIYLYPKKDDEEELYPGVRIKIRGVEDDEEEEAPPPLVK